MSTVNIEKLKINDWQLLDLKKSENLRFIKSLVIDFTITLNPGDSSLLYKALKISLDKLGDELRKENLNLYNKYQTELKKLEILSLINFDLDQVKEILKNNLIFIFENKLPILALLTSYTRWRKENFYINISAFTDSLSKNDEKLGVENIVYSVNKNDIVPRIKDWVNNYIIYTEGRPSKMNGLSLSGYLSSNEDVRKLSKEDQLILEKVLKMFNIFANPENYENYYRQPYLFDLDGGSDEEEIEEIVNDTIKDSDAVSSKEDFINYYNEIKDKYFKGIRVNKVTDEIEIINSVDKAIDNNNINSVIDLLIDLIEINKFDLIEKINLFSKWKIEYLKEFKSLDIINLSNKDQRIILHGQFLKMLLYKKLSLNNDESVIIMIHLANALKQRGEENYLPLTYANLSDNKFYWREIVIEDGKLVLK